METNVINIGNSMGIIIPSKILTLLGIEGKVQLTIEGEKLIIKPLSSNIRANWAAQFESASSDDQDPALIPDVFEDEEFDDWTW